MKLTAKTKEKLGRCTRTGVVLYLLMQKHRISVTNASRDAGLSINAISISYEMNSRFDYLYRICSACGISMSEFSELYKALDGGMTVSEYIANI